MNDQIPGRPWVEFDDFEPVSAKQWKQKIQYDLKGADYNDTLVWQSLEGINVKPFYHKDDFENGFQSIPGHPNSWLIAQEIFIDDVFIANAIAIDAIKRGAEAIVFIAKKEFDYKLVFKNFPLKSISIYFDFKFLSEEFLIEIKTFLKHQNAKVFYNIDIIGNLAKTGNWFQGPLEDHRVLQKLISADVSKNLLGVDISTYQNAGANIVQQLAYALGHANEYLNHLDSLNQLNEEKRSSNANVIGEFEFTFKLSIGSNYFFEIAKIRALRKLYATLAAEYGARTSCHILTMPSTRNKTLYDYNVNMLRTTTECMSAILGGADTVFNLAYDVLYHKSNEFGQRIARNQLLILKYESGFDAVSNPSDGAYYIESLTDELASKALDVFKEIERGGGFLSQLKEGTIQKKIKESGDKEQRLFDNGDLKLLGTNHHPNKNDRMKDYLELFPFLKRNPVKTHFPPIVSRRLSEFTEQERLNLES